MVLRQENHDPQNNVPRDGRPIRLAQIIWQKNQWLTLPVGPRIIGAMENWLVPIRVYDYYRAPHPIRQLFDQTPIAPSFEANVLVDMNSTPPHYVVVYNGQRRKERVWWSLAHEFGHVVLGHAFSKGWHNEPRKEREADMFAAELLLPLGAVREVHSWPLDQIARCFGTSMEATHNRLKDLAGGWLRLYTIGDIEEGRKRVLHMQPIAGTLEATMAQLDEPRQILQVDWNEGEQAVRWAICPYCEFENNSLYAQQEIRCGQCGTWLINTCLSARCRLYGLPLPESYRYCGRCGSETSWTQVGTKSRESDEQALPDDLPF